MVFIVLRKLILQTRMRSHPVGLDVCFFFCRTHSSTFILRVCKQRRLWRDCADFARAFAGRQCDKYHNLMSWLIWCRGRDVFFDCISSWSLSFHIYLIKQLYSILLTIDLNGVWFCCFQKYTKYEPRHDKTNNVTVRPAKTQISLGIRPVWSESSLSAWRKLGSLATH